MRKLLILGLALVLVSTIHAFPLVFDNYKLTSVTPKGKIVGDRAYEDRTIRIEFRGFTGDYPEFTLKNISNKPLTIIWDLCAFIDSEGRSDSVLRKGIPFQNRGNSIPSTIVVPGAYVDEIMVPIGSIQYIDGDYVDGQWKATNSIFKVANQTVSIVLTVEQNERQTIYIFVFESTTKDGAILVERGSFSMGDEVGDLWDKCRPVHQVTLTYDFEMAKYEVTFDQYDAFCEETGRSKPSDEGWGRGARPVINVSWWDAIAYCNWLSEKEKLPKAYDTEGNFLDKDGIITADPSKVLGYRLPTEAEWEYSARGGNKSKGYIYAGSNDVDQVGWYWDNSGLSPQEVGRKMPNELGLYDLSGNVDEWCSDWRSGYYEDQPIYNDYTDLEETNPYSNYGTCRMTRGGNFLVNARGLRIADRSFWSPSHKDFCLGFRICKTVP